MSISKFYIISGKKLSQIKTPVEVAKKYGDQGAIKIKGKSFLVVKTESSEELKKELADNISDVDLEITPASISQVPENFDWARLRLISRNRPFLTKWQVADVKFPKSTNVYVLDSGINAGHTEFNNIKIKNFFKNKNFEYNDLDGHGTAVASFICGANVGVHQKLTLINCKLWQNEEFCNVLEIYNCLDKILQAYTKNPIPSVVNISWTVDKNIFLETKIQELIDKGITVVCAAGNNNINVNTVSPAGMESAITVAASDIDDVSAGFNNFSDILNPIETNFGELVDIFAPGVDCIGADISSDSAYKNYSGTSISAAFVTGCLAAIHSLYPKKKSKVVKEILLEYATAGALLLDLDQFGYKQNLLPCLISSSNSISFSESNFYLGYCTADKPVITANINMMMNVARFSSATGEKFSYSVVTDKVAKKSITVDNKGNFKVSNPKINWKKEKQQMKLFEFKIVATSKNKSIKFQSPTLVYYATDPSAAESIFSDISSALETANAQSFFATVAPLALK